MPLLPFKNRVAPNSGGDDSGDAQPTVQVATLSSISRKRRFGGITSLSSLTLKNLSLKTGVVFSDDIDDDIDKQSEADSVASASRVSRKLSGAIRTLSSLTSERGSFSIDPIGRPQRHKRPRGGEYRRCVVHPQSPLRFFWDCLILLSMLITAVLLPLQLAEFSFADNDGMLIFDQVLNSIFILDVVLNFHTGYVSDQQRTVVLDRRLTRKHYLRGWFVPDAIAAIPFNLIIELAFDDDSDVNALKALRLVRMLRFLRLKRIVERLEITARMQSYTKTTLCARVIRARCHPRTDAGCLTCCAPCSFRKFIVVTFMFAHWTCCFWYLLGKSGNAETGQT